MIVPGGSSLSSAVVSAGQDRATRGAGTRRSAVVGQTARRIFNVVVASAGLVILAVPFAVIMVMIKTTSPGPVFFRQVRVGRGGRPFRIYKFRTMVENGS